MKNFRFRSLVGIAFIFVFLLNLFLILASLILGKSWMMLLALILSAVQFIAHDYFQRKHTLLRNFPVVGRLRYLFERLRSPLAQYFIESDLSGKPFSRRQRSIVYQRSKNVRQTVAFGMQADPYSPGFEWISHSVYPVGIENRNLRVRVGSSQCTHPYEMSVLNISAMSYGALSKTAVMSLSEGANIGGFAMNTGEGGISPYHIRGGADLIWQIGTGYFGCRDLDGSFDAGLFEKNATRPYVKMIELKLSQGAKPGHGGLLPAIKNTPEIAAIRNVVPGTTVHSPKSHTAFGNATEMVWFLKRLRELSGGKPVGIKLCIGSKREFEQICEAMLSTGVHLDFITIDGAEGGTGAAPLEFTDHVGMPLFDALALARKTLTRFGLPSKIIVSGKIITAFDVLRAIALGADACYSARGMMLSLGCIQALQCDSGKCPVGITTQNKRLYRGLDVTDKRVRVANFHRNTIEAVVELMEACGYKTLADVNPGDFYRRINRLEIRSLSEIYFNDEQNPRTRNEVFTCLN